MLRQGPENWTSKEYRGIRFVRFRVFQCFTRPKWHSSRRCGKSCRDEALGTGAGPCWTMLGPRTLIWLKNIEKPQLYVEEQPDVDLETWIMFWMSHHAVIALDLGKWSCKTLYQRPPAFTLSVFISNCEHTQKVYSTFPCKGSRQQIPGDIAQLWYQFVLHIEISETSIDLHLPSSLTWFRLIWKKFWHVPNVHQPWYPECLFATHTMEERLILFRVRSTHRKWRIWPCIMFISQDIFRPFQLCFPCRIGVRCFPSKSSWLSYGSNHWSFEYLEPDRRRPHVCL